MTRVPYSKVFHLPAPVIGVRIGHPDGPASQLIAAQLDTGSDRTVIPLSVAIALGLPYLREIQAGVVGGSVLTLPLYLVALTIPGVMDFVIDVAAGDEPRVLLGRDVLNALHTHLDGPGRMLTLSAQPLTSIP